MNMLDEIFKNLSKIEFQSECKASDINTLLPRVYK